MAIEAIAQAAPSVLNLLGGLFGLGADKAKNKRADAELAIQRDLANQQIDLSRYIQGLSEQLMARGSTQVDPYGGTTGYDAATGTYRSTLGAIPAELQALSDAEERARLTTDQATRRAGILDSEMLRRQAVDQSSATNTDINNFRQGIGRVDPSAIAAQLRTDRTRAVNAGYDDAARAAQTMQVRTGNSAIGSALERLARDRVRAQSEIGSAEVEGLQLADQLNSARLGDKMSAYDSFTNQGRSYLDAGFTPAPYAAAADAKTADAMKFDLSKYEVAQGGSSNAAATLGSAGAGLRQGYAATEANRVHAPTAQFLAGLSNLFKQQPLKGL